jgi:trk system potassium uptake protein TrkH
MQQFTGSLVSYPARVSFGAYVLAILLGGLILTTPLSRNPGCEPITLVDGIFTATSACCVTGLTVRSTVDDFSFFGQVVILLLIQLGGLGIMTITTLASFQFGGQASMRQRAIVAETLGIRSGRDLRWVTWGVLAAAFFSEGIGFIFLTVSQWGTEEPSRVIWKSLFHAVSAFCNAGFALDNDNLIPEAGNVSVNLVICGLIIIGGLGFPVIFDIAARIRKRDGLWTRLHTQSKIMLLGTAGLLVFGMVSFCFFEWNESLNSKPIATRILMGFFHSTTCRTAGFNTVDYALLSNTTLFLAILLMAIGAGPCSTAGGFKVSTFMTLLARSWASFRGLRHVNLFRRTIPAASVERATATVLLFAAVAVGAMVALLTAEHGGHLEGRQRWFLEALFECISALGTVGLSTGITASLSDPGKLVLVGLMFLGRLGPITAALALSQERTTYQPTYPEEEPLIG